MTPENPSPSVTQEALAFNDPEQLLSDDHAELDELLHALVLSLDQGDPAEMFTRLDLFWARLAMHIRAEHLHLFPAIIEVIDHAAGASEDAQSRVPGAIKMLRSDHDFFMKELARAVKLMRVERNAEAVKEVREIIITLMARLAEHNKIEEETIYNLASRILTTAQQSVLVTVLYRELHHAPPRFAELNRPVDSDRLEQP